MSKTSALRKNLKNGKPNPKYVDWLEEDKPISGQKFVCMSFVSPEDILQKKEVFFFEQFLKQWEFSKSMEKFYQFLNFMSFKYKIAMNDIAKDFEEFVKEEKETLKYDTLMDDYKTFIENNEEALQTEFDKNNEFKTSIRGFKVRGVFSTKEEAELRCKMLKENDPSHNIHVGPVGLWIPWDPKNVTDIVYMEEELNQLMSEKNKNEAIAKSAFDERVKESKKKAIQENIEIAKKTGAVLTQTIDEDGNLISINNVNTQEKALTAKDEITTKDIETLLFEDDEIERKR